MSAVSHAGNVRRDADPIRTSLSWASSCWLAPRLGRALADRLFREIDAYRDGTVVSKDEVAESCAANLTYVFHSLAGHADDDVQLPSTPEVSARSPVCRYQR